MTGSERALAGGGRGGGSRNLLSSPRKTALRSAGVINYLQLSSLPHSARQKKSCQGEMKIGGREKRDEKTEGRKRRSGGFAGIKLCWREGARTRRTQCLLIRSFLARRDPTNSPYTL